MRHDFASASRANVLRIFLSSRLENTQASNVGSQLHRPPLRDLQLRPWRVVIPVAISDASSLEGPKERLAFPAHRGS